MKCATTIEDQLALLRSRGVIIDNEDKAREMLEDIGFYRLGFYAFPFEKTFPKQSDRDHCCVDGTRFEDIAELYYFDCDLRRTLTYFLNRIEVNVRTQITYICSNAYKTNPYWFVSPQHIKHGYTSAFEDCVYKTLRKNPVIIRHHKKYINDKYAPAWKTLEFMTMGNIVLLYSNLKDTALQEKISAYYGCRLNVFTNYINTIRMIRNSCAHGSCIYNIKLATGIKKGPAGNPIDDNRQNINGAIAVIEYIMGRISENRKQDMKTKIANLLGAIRSPRVRSIVEICSGFSDKDLIL